MKITKGEILSTTYEELNEDFLKELAKEITSEFNIQPHDEHHDGPDGNYQFRATVEEQLLAMKWADLPTGKLGMIFFLEKIPAVFEGTTKAIRVKKFVVQLRDKKLMPEIEIFHGDTE